MSCSVRPERYRDLAWENELVCYRIYSKELEWETVSQGIDMWCKRVSTPIIDTLYHRRDYHHDHGEGMDCYKVGRSLGAGASALMHEDKLVLGRNYTSSRILDCGPVRVCFEVDYPADTLPGGVCQKTKRFTLDRGSFFTKVEDRFLSGLPSIETAMGLRRNSVESVELLKDCIFLSEKPSDSRQPELDGTIFLALVCPEADSVKATDKNWCLVKRLRSDRHITYYIASAWSLAPWVKDISSWKDIVKSFRTGLNEPLEVTTNRIRP